MAAEKRTIRVFYSSPFRGLERERELLTKLYWPQVTNACARKGLTFIPIDFRWGITAENSMAANTVSICLKEVRKCDVFIGFFGCRYGWHGVNDGGIQKAIDQVVREEPWLEAYRDRSVTEMEFLRGRLLGLNEDRPTALFFRDPNFDRQQFEILRKTNPSEAKYFMPEIDGGDSEELLKQLKNRCFQYQDEISPESARYSVGEYSTPEEGAKAFFEATISILNDKFLQADSKPVSEVESWIAAQSKTRKRQVAMGDLFIGRENEKQSLERFLSDPEINRVVITGEEGSGKSSFILNFLNSHSSVLLPIYYNLNAFPDANKPTRVLQFILASIQNEVNGSYDENSLDLGDPQTRVLIQKISAILDSNQSKSFVIVIDELDSISDKSSVDVPLGWLPLNLPIKTVVSVKATDSFHIPAITNASRVSTIKLQSFSHEESMEIINSAIGARGKELNQKCLDFISACESKTNLLFSKVLLDLLFTHGEFETLEAKVESLSGCVSTRELFEKFLDGLESDMSYERSYVPKTAGDALAFLALSSEGLSEKEIGDLAGISPEVWHLLSNILEPFLDISDNLYTIGFSDLKHAIDDRFLVNEHKQNYWTEFAEYFWEDFQEKAKLDSAVIPRRLARQLPSALKMAGMKEELKELLSSLVFFKSCRDSLASKNEERKVRGLLSYEYSSHINESGIDVPEILAKLEKSVTDSIISSYITNYSNSMQVRNEGVYFEAVNDLQRIIDFGHDMSCYEECISIAATAIKIQTREVSRREEKSSRETYIQHRLCLAQIYGMYAISLYHTSRYEEAERAAVTSCHITESHVEEDRSAEGQMAISHHTLGNIYQSQREVERAKRCFQVAWEKHRSVGSSHQWSSLDMLAFTHLLAGDTETAETLSKQVVDHFEWTVTERTDASIAGFICNHANALRRNGKLEQASALYDKALDIQRRLLGDQHHAIAITLSCLGNLALAQQHWALAAQRFETAYHIYANTVGFKSNETALAAENVAMALCKVGDFAGGMRWLEQAGELLRALHMLHLTMPWMNRVYLQHFHQNKQADHVFTILNRMRDAGIQFTEPEHQLYNILTQPAD